MIRHALNQWNKWPQASLQIAYKRPGTASGIGPGEDRCAFTFETSLLGSNSPFDMTLTIHNVRYPMAEVKQLDGIEFAMHKLVAKKLRPIQANIASFVSRIPDLQERIRNHITEDLADLTGLEDLIQDEVSSGNIKILVNSFKILNRLIIRLQKEQTMFHTVDSFGKSITVNSSHYLRKLRADHYSSEFIETTMTTSQYEIARLLVDYLDHPFIDNPDKMMGDLNSLTEVFKDLLMIFVTEEGYYIMTDPYTKIVFSRITRGCKFKLLTKI